MTRQDISLNDRYDLTKSQVLLNGTQALVRLMLMQKARDVAVGLNTAGYGRAIEARRLVRWICRWTVRQNRWLRRGLFFNPD